LGFVLASNLIVDSRGLSAEGDLMGIAIVGRIVANFAEMMIGVRVEMTVDIVLFGMDLIVAF
jgi:hypothetical protein